MCDFFFILKELWCSLLPKSCLRMNWRPLCLWKTFKTNSQIGSRTLTSVCSLSQGRSWRIYCVLRGVIHVLSGLLPLPQLGLIVFRELFAFSPPKKWPPRRRTLTDTRFPNGPTQQHGSRYVYIVWRPAWAFSGIRARGRERLQQSSYFFIKNVWASLEKCPKCIETWRQMESNSKVEATVLFLSTKQHALGCWVQKYFMWLALL